MSTNTTKYLAPTNGKFKLKNFDTDYKGHLDKDTVKEDLAKLIDVANKRLPPDRGSTAFSSYA